MWHNDRGAKIIIITDFTDQNRFNRKVMTLLQNLLQSV